MAMIPGKVVYPGSFDPVTLGHLDLIRRARAVFGGVVVAVAENTSGKTPLFTGVERAAMLSEATAGLAGVEVDLFSGVLVDYLKRRGAHTVVRGLRSGSDFDGEFRMALTNRRLSPGVETVFLVPDEQHFCLSSTLIRELAGLGADVSLFVPPAVVARLRARFPGAGRQ